MKTCLTLFVVLMSGCCMVTSELNKGNNWPCENPVNCTEGKRFGDPADCQCYYQCSSVTGHLVRECCGTDMCFHLSKEECFWCHSSECQQPCPATATLIELTQNPTTAGALHNGPTTGSSTTEMAGIRTTDTNDVEDNWPCKDPVDCVDGDRYGDPANCSCYYECNATGLLHHDCCPAPDQCFDLALKVCKYCHHVTECQQPCGTTTGTIETPLTSPSPGNDWPCVTPVNCSGGERFGDPANCNCYYQCNATGALVHECCPYDRQCFHPCDGQCRWCHELESGCQQPCDEKTESACYEDGAVLSMECLPSEVIVIVWRTTLFGVSQPCDGGALCCPANTSCSIFLSESEHNAPSAHWDQVDSCNGERACTVNVTQDISNCGQPTDYENITYRCVTATTVLGTVEMTTVTTVSTVSPSRPTTTSQNPEDTWPCKHPVNCVDGDRFGDPANCSCYYQCNATGFLHHDCCPVGQPDQCFEPALGECKYCHHVTQCQQPCPISKTTNEDWTTVLMTTGSVTLSDEDEGTIKVGVVISMSFIIAAVVFVLSIQAVRIARRRRRKRRKQTDNVHTTPGNDNVAYENSYLTLCEQSKVENEHVYATPSGGDTSLPGNETVTREAEDNCEPSRNTNGACGDSDIECDKVEEGYEKPVKPQTNIGNASGVQTTTQNPEDYININ